MAKTKYVIGLDYGTLSGRAVLVEAATGEIAAQAVKEYPHAVMDRELPCGVRLEVDWALQHPQDYLDVLTETVPAVLRQAGIAPQEVIGLSIDFTASTVLPIDRDGTPLCFLPAFEARPHAYVKLWKHHAAQPEADEINALLAARGEIDLPRYGGKISSELTLPKALQILREDPEIYQCADQILEASDWLTFLLTGSRRRTGSTAGYKAMWLEGEGYPEQAFLRALDPRLETYPEDKLGEDICPVGSRIGELNPAWAEKLGLLPGTAVGASIIDAHAGLPGCGITKPGQMLLIIGTSSVQAALSDRPYSGGGICGAVKGGIMPGYYALESGLAGVGDIFGWFVNHCVPAAYHEQAKGAGCGMHEYLTRLAEKLVPGESGLLALDWWSGNKTPFVDVDLSGMIVGYTLSTRPEEVYRALIEATGFGTRLIMEAFEDAGVLVDEIRACGGIVEKNPLLMQIYADITNREIKVAASQQTAALGAAMYAAVAAGSERGGYDSIFDAAQAMGRIQEKTYRPIPAHVAVYETLYREYCQLKDYFGAKNPVMKILKQIRQQAWRQSV